MLKRLMGFSLLAAAACSIASASPDQWTQVNSSHFVVTTNANEKQARHLLDQFERMRWVFQTLFPKVNADPASPIEVYAAKNNKTFQAVEPAAYLSKGSLSLAGYFMPTQDKNFILLRLDAEHENHPFATVYHEYTHLQFRSAGEWMPIWLNEGLAEFFQNTDIRDKEVLLGEPSGDDLLRLREERIIPLPVLFKVDASSPYYHEENKGSVFYSESWALTHFLMVSDRENKTNKVTDYMRLMSQHEDSVAAAEKAFGDLKQLQKALESYIHASQYKQFLMHSAAAPIDESSYVAKPVSAAEADAIRAELLAMVKREKESRDLVDSILKADPNNVHAREVMGLLEFRAGNREAARKWYGEAVKLNPKSCLANYYFASISMQEGGVEDAEIESSLRAAIAANPKFAPAYDRLASFYGMRHKNLDDALSLALSAVKLDPGNLYFRMNASNVLAVSDRYPDAIKVLQSAVKLARNPGETAMVQSRIEQLDQTQKRKAQADEERRRYEAQANAPAEKVSEAVGVVAPETKYPDEAKGPKHSFVGVMREVTCGYPSILVFRVEGAKSAIKVYNNSFSKIDLTVIGFIPKGPINPCTDFNGMKARVQYAETTDKSVDGQVLAIELRK
jgi:tetratricopeptide (TPR) repeat protein